MPSAIHHLILFICLLLPATTLAQSTLFPRKLSVLLIDGQNNHDWPRATRILTSVLESSGRFAVTVSTTPPAGAPPEAWDAWRPDFPRYDVVLSNFNSGHKPDATRWPPEVERAFEHYISSGGGFVAYHAANNAFLSWPAYNEMIGLAWRPKDFGPSIVIDDAAHPTTLPASSFARRPQNAAASSDGQSQILLLPPGRGLDPGHGKEHVFTITTLDPTHPITRGLPKYWTHPHEQLTHGQHGPAKNLHVLTYAWSKDARENEPLDWTVTYGKGRVYVTLLGHLWKDGPTTALDCPAFQTFLLRGTEWAATGSVTLPLPPNFPTAPAKAPASRPAIK